TEEFLLGEAGRGSDRKDLPPEFRAYLGCIRLALECDPPMTPQQVRRKIDAGIQSEFPDIAQTTYEVKPAGPPDEAGAFRDLEARIQVGYNQEIGGKPAHELWTGIVKNALAKPPQFATVTSFSEQIGKEARRGAIQAIFWSLLAIVGYIWLRFARVGYGIAAIAALVHDVFITLGAVV
ncbi:MAG: hypothetical protein QF662_09540, partial [Phycisphaerae bacterium]|nr:hypothetical protein [Phycisphaerae bacterium]